jgi:diguanylate cyclase (GGDEF)-like protein
VKVIQHLLNIHPAVLLCSNILLIILIGVIDYFTSSELTLSIFYVLPIILIQWRFSLAIGIAACLLSFTTLLVADLLPGNTYSNPSVPFWNSFVRLAIFLTIVYIFNLQREVQKELQSTHQELEKRVATMERRNHEITNLSEMVDFLQSSNQAEEAFRVISLFAKVLFPDRHGALCLINNDVVEIVSIWGKPVSDQVFTPNDCWALRRGRMHVVNDVEHALLCNHLKSQIHGAFICIPMMAQGEMLGSVILHTSTELQVQDEFEIQLFTTFVEQTSLAVSNLQLRETLRNQAIRDPLTDLFNRRYAEETLNRELRRAVRNNAPVGILIIDVDHFKSFNDNFGHESGDAVLVGLAKVMKSQIRGGDVASRFGGEEFLMILPDTALQDCAKRAEQLRSLIKDLRIQYVGQSLPPITVSIGIAEFPTNGYNAEAVIRAADNALYRAKNSGRDCVSFAIHNLDKNPPEPLSEM